MIKSLFLVLILISGTVHAQEDRQPIYDFIAQYECSAGPGKHLVAYIDYKGYSI